MIARDSRDRKRDGSGAQERAGRATERKTDANNGKAAKRNSSRAHEHSSEHSTHQTAVIVMVGARPIGTRVLVAVVTIAIAAGLRAAAQSEPGAMNVTEAVIEGLSSHLGSLNMSWDLGGGNGTSIVPLVLTRLATNWLNSTLASMQEYYSAGTRDANQTVSDFVSKIAASAVQDIINPAANLCLSS